MGPERFTLRIAGPAVRSLSERLPEAVAAAVLEFLRGDLLLTPYRVGKPLIGELSGSFSARRGSYRVIYSVDDAAREVTVLLVEHRRDAYRR